MDFNSLQSLLKSARREYADKKAANDYLKSEAAKLSSRLDEVSGKLEVSKKASDFLVSIANQRRDGAKSRIEKAATDAVQAIYGPDYSVKLEISQKANRSNLEIKVCKKTPDGVVERDMDGIGGGVSDTVSIPLRLMVLSASDTDRVAILDEAWKHLDQNRIGRVGKLLENICEGMGMQIIFVTHHHSLCDSGNVISLQ